MQNDKVEKLKAVIRARLEAGEDVSKEEILHLAGRLAVDPKTGKIAKKDGAVNDTRADVDELDPKTPKIGKDVDPQAALERHMKDPVFEKALIKALHGSGDTLKTILGSVGIEGINVEEIVEVVEPRYEWRQVYDALPTDMYDGTNDKDPRGATNIDGAEEPEIQALAILKKQITELQRMNFDGSQMQCNDLAGQFVSTYDQYSADKNALGHIESYVDRRRAELEEQERERLLEQELQRKAYAALENEPDPSFKAAGAAPGMGLFRA